MILGNKKYMSGGAGKFLELLVLSSPRKKKLSLAAFRTAFGQKPRFG